MQGFLHERPQGTRPRLNPRFPQRPLSRRLDILAELMKNVPSQRTKPCKKVENLEHPEFLLNSRKMFLFKEQSLARARVSRRLNIFAELMKTFLLKEQSPAKKLKM